MGASKRGLKYGSHCPRWRVWKATPPEVANYEMSSFQAWSVVGGGEHAPTRPAQLEFAVIAPLLLPLFRPLSWHKSHLCVLSISGLVDVVMNGDLDVALSLVKLVLTALYRTE